MIKKSKVAGEAKRTFLISLAKKKKKWLDGGCWRVYVNTTAKQISEGEKNTMAEEI